MKEEPEKEQTKIWYLDTEESQLEKVSSFLENQDNKLEVQTSPRAESIIKNFKSRKISGIISDYDLEDKNGIQLLKTVREDLESEIPFVMFTKTSREEIAVNALNLGADHYLRQRKGNKSKSQSRYQELYNAIEKEIDRKSIEQLKSEEKIFEATFNASPDPTIIFDTEGICRHINQSFVDKLGYEKDELLGQAFADLPYFSKDILQKSQDKFEKQKQGEKIQPYEVEVETKEGNSLLVELNLGIIENDDLEGIVTVARDLTEKRKIKNKFETYIESAPYAVFVTDSEGNYQGVNSAAEGITGYSQEELLSMNLLDLYDPKLDKKASEMFSNLKEKGEMRAEMPFLTKGGIKRFWDIYAVQISDNEFLGFVDDITKRKKWQEKLKKSEDRYKSLFENSPIPIWEQDLSELKNYLNEREDKVEDIDKFIKESNEVIENFFEEMEIIDVNQNSIDFYEAESKEHLINNLEDILTEESHPVLREQILAIKNNECCFRSEEKIETLEGKEKDIILEMNVPESEEDEYSRAYVTVTDITKQKQLKEELEESAIKDPLTGLYNRRYLDSTVEKEISRGERYEHELGIMMIDVNRFKEINDTYTHQTGDKVLKEIADILENSTREADSVFRYGGDEYLILLPETNGEVEYIKERLNQQFDNWNKESNLLDFPLSASIGYNHWSPKENQDFEDALKEADKKMYEEKNGTNERDYSA